MKQPNVVYVGKPEYINELCEELRDEVTHVVGNLVFAQKLKPQVCFALDVWCEPRLVEFKSISEAVRILREAHKYWFLNPIENIRRSRLIEQQLYKLPPLDRHFPLDKAIPSIGCFSLLDQNTLIYSSHRWKKWPLGHSQFIEDKAHPPNRAYLKLWDALTLLNRYPKPGETALDLGASPGGWTYVMQSLGAHVEAVDKAPLDARIAQLPNVSFLQQSAFALNPEEWNKKVDWLLCDIACYPERLYDLTTKWIAADKAKQMIFTIKLQGKTDLDIIKKFQAIPHSRTVHLFHNKHEATFFYPAVDDLFARC